MNCYPQDTINNSSEPEFVITSEHILEVNAKPGKWNNSIKMWHL